jgi:Reductase C-terminal
MTTSSTFAIVGGGLAGAAAEALRDKDFDGHIVLFAAAYDELPYFFTDQYDLGMEYVGYASGYDKVVYRGDVGAREFTAFWLDGDSRVLAGMNVNIWEGLDDIKSLIRSRESIDPSKLSGGK